MDESNNQLPPQQPDNVWISREEYVRLKQEAAAANSAAPVAVGESYEDDTQSKQESRWTIIGLAALGILTLLAFTTSAFSFSAPVLLVILLLAGALSLARALRFKGAPQVARVNQNKPRNTVVLILIIMGILLVAPQAVMMIFMIIIMLPFMIMSGGRGT